MLSSAPLRTLDPEIYAAIAAELGRQQSHIELIASENFTYPAVMEAQGSVLTNKYAEGYPAKRWYGGCEQVDKVETLAIPGVPDGASVRGPMPSPDGRRLAFRCGGALSILDLDAKDVKPVFAGLPCVRWPPWLRFMPSTLSPGWSTAV